MNEGDRSMLTGLPFEAQRRAIDELIPRVRGDRSLDELRSVLASLEGESDPTPLARLLRGLLAEPDVASSGAVSLVLRRALEVGDAALLPVVQVLREAHGAGRPEGVRAAVVEALGEVAHAVAVERVEAHALLVQTLVRLDPEAHEARCAAARAAIAEEIARRPGLEEVSDGVLRVLRGRDRAGFDAHPAFRARYERFARETLGHLARAPRTLAQASAQDLLSRRLYADPSHFLFELVQNADDAGATRFSLRVRRGALVASHDGAPFDARDVVGVLSVGLSTKGEGQIGTFGVGFKSVYQVSDRPQVHAPPFHFELAGPSLPRPLDASHAPFSGEGGGEGTALVLPLRGSAEEQARVAREVLAAAVAMPSEVLLTLRHLRALAVYEGEGDAVQRRVERRGREGSGEAVLVEVGADGVAKERAFLLAERGRARVAVALDARGAPCALDAGSPEVFSWLPTRERSGLGVLVHAPFALRVDRERVDFSDPHNARCVGEAARALASALASRAASHAAQVRAVVPDAGDLAPALRSPVLEALDAELASVELFPAADGALRAARSLVVLPHPALADALRGCPLARSELVAAGPMSARETRLALRLGARTLDARETVALLAELGPARWPSGLVLALALAVRDGALRDAYASLRALPFLQTPLGGALVEPARAARADDALASLYAEARPVLVAPDRVPSELFRALCDALGVRELTHDDLARDLADPALRPLLLSRASPHSTAALWSALARAAPPARAPLSREPVALDDRGDPCAPGELFLAADPALVALLAGWVGPRPRLAHPTLAAGHAALLAELGAQALDLLQFACSSYATDASPEDLAALHAALDRASGELTPRALARLALAPLYPDTRSARRPLRGAPAVTVSVVPANDALVALAPDAPWLAEPLRALAHVRAIEPEVLDDESLVASLTGAPHPALSTVQPAALLAHLASRAATLSAPALAALSSAPIWPTTDGRALPLGTWDRPALDRAHAPSPHAALRAALALAGVPELALAEAPDGGPLPALLAALDRRAPTVRDLLRCLRASPPPVATPEHARVLRRALLSQLPVLHEATDDELRPLRELALWPARTIAGETLAPARDLVRPSEARSELSLEIAAPWLDDGRTAQLDEASEPEAAQLAFATPFAPPKRSLAAFVRAHAVNGAALSSQPALLETPARVAAALTALGADAAGLALCATRPGTLVAAPVRALDDPDALLLLDALGASHRLAHPAWYAALAPELRQLFSPPFTPVAVLRALVEAPPPAAALARHETRAALYRWLLREGPSLIADPEPRAWLARAPLFPDAAGTLRAASALSFEPAPPELAMPDAGPHEEVPPALARWLGDTFVTEGARLENLVSRLLDAHESALAAGEGARADLALEHLARSLRDPARQVPALPRGLKLHRRLRALDASGARRRPRELLDAPDEHRALLSAFLPADPPFVHPRYDAVPEVRALLAACETPRALDADALRALLDAPAATAPRPLEARLALARYVALRALETPALRSELALDARPWLLDSLGAPRAPRALYWPDASPETPPAPEATLHPQLALTLPAELGSWLHFLRPGDPVAKPASPAPALVTSPPPASRGASAPDHAPPALAAAVTPWHRRMRDWLRAPRAEAPAASVEARPSRASSPPDAPKPRAPRTPASHDEGAFAPTQHVRPQLRNTRSWIDDHSRAPEYSLVHAPRELPSPYTYAPHTLADLFDARTQSWTRSSSDPSWLRGEAPTNARVAFRGELPAGPALLPLPFYASLSVADARLPGRLDRDRHGRPLAFVEVTGDPSVSFHAVLHRPPAFDDEATAFGARDGVPASLVQHTAPDDELPPEVHDFVASLRAFRAPMLQRALEVVAFVRSRYRYDPSYLEDASVAQWLAGLTEGRAHAHLAALHAGRDASHLGRGVCFELNTLVCELLRRVGVPAAICTGWVLDAGELSLPDHLWAVALLPTPRGPRWMPLDASVTAEGRPLRVSRRPPSSRRAPPTPAMPSGGLPPPPAWAATGTRGAAHANEGTPRTRAPRDPRTEPPALDLLRVTRWLEALAGAAPAQASRVNRALDALRTDPERARAMLRALLRDPDGP